jgi:hypothetical protein
MRSFRFLANSWDVRFSGWRGGIVGFSFLAVVVLMINISVLVWTATHLDDGHYATVTVRSCKSVGKMTFYAQLIINMFSTVLLAGSNYCMQCLSSPTRSEVDSAHAQNSYLNIGILSWRNVVSFRKRRMCLLLALVLSGVPLLAVYAPRMQIMVSRLTVYRYSSSVSIKSAVQVYGVAHVSSKFLSGGTFTQHGNIDSTLGHRYEDRIEALQNLTIGGQIWDRTLWTNLTIAECRDYGAFEFDRGSILLVTEDTPSVMDQNHAQPFDGASNGNNEGTVFEYRLEYRLQVSGPRSNVEDIFLSAERQPSYCLSLKVPGVCSLQIHIWLLLVVVVSNIVKLICFMLVFKEQSGTPLMTVGDAVASFLRSPCLVSRGMCLLSEDELIRAPKQGSYDEVDAARRQPKQFQTRCWRYYHSISFVRWTVYTTAYVPSLKCHSTTLITSIRCMLVILTSSYLSNAILTRYRKDSTDATLFGIWKKGFGNFRSDSWSDTNPPWCYIYPMDSDARRRCVRYGREMSSILISSLPQLIISGLYIAINHQLTIMVHLRDWTRLVLRQQPLRVSDPEPNSAQISTYWLSLPYRYSISLLISSVALGWLVSQALFPVRFLDYDHAHPYKMGTNQSWLKAAVDPKGVVPQNLHLGVAYSALAVYSSITAGVTVFVISLALGLKKCAPGMSLGPTNSLVIAAACHPPHNDRNAARKLVQWGVVQSGDDANEDPVLHCTITSQKVIYPEEGRWYA